MAENKAQIVYVTLHGLPTLLNE